MEIPFKDCVPPDLSSWSGVASAPGELADEFATATSFSRHFPNVEPMELVTVTMSVANRDLIVEALRRMAQKH